jgi:hypothetical protein
MVIKKLGEAIFRSSICEVAVRDAALLRLNSYTGFFVESCPAGWAGAFDGG